MRLCLYEDPDVTLLEPLALTRPAFDLRCGAQTLLDRHQRLFAACERAAWVRPHLADLCRLQHPELAVNDAAWLRSGPVVLVNARWLPDAAPGDLTTPHVGLVGRKVAYLVLPDADPPPAATEALADWLAEWQARLPGREAGGTLLDYLWDYVDHTGDAIRGDEAWFRAQPGVVAAPSPAAVVGPADRLLVAADAAVEPYVTADTRGGPVLIDRGAVVHSFTRLEGPCYVGPGTWLLGAKVRAGTSFGPGCRIGGEVEASVVLSNSNKYHDGFLGHSYVGEWVNLAAGTQTSDLRNDYEAVRVVVGGKRVATGSLKIGSYVGDHSKTGLGALFNTGSVVGAFANVLPSGTYAPKVVPSFCQVNQGQVQETWDLRKLFQTAAQVMRRRGQALTDVHTDLYYAVFDQTAEARRRALRDGEYRRLRRSV